MSEYIIEENDSNRRVDRVARRFLKNAPISFVYSSIRNGLIRLNGSKVKPNVLTTLNDVLYIDERLEECKTIESKIIKNSIELDVILKTEHLLFLNKRAGCVTHGKNSIDEIVKKKFPASNSLSFSVGALHRLDKDTSGILTFSQSLKGAKCFSKAIRNGELGRYYIGINEGYLKTATWKILNHKNSLLEYEITKTWLIEYSKKDDLSLSLYKLVTGKKHQIRYGAKYFATPLFCDSLYGSKRHDFSIYFLHSFALSFSNPMFNDVPPVIFATLPNYFLKAIKNYFPIINEKIEKKGNLKLLKELVKKKF